MKLNLNSLLIKDHYYCYKEDFHGLERKFHQTVSEYQVKNYFCINKQIFIIAVMLR